MRIFQNISLRRKQTLIMMATSSVVLLLACVAFSIYEVTAFRNTMRQNLATLADIVDHNTTAALDFNDPKSAEETLAALQADPAIIGAWVYAKDGEVFAKYDRPNDNIIFAPPVILPNGTIFQGQRLILCRPIMMNGETVGTLYLESDMSALTTRLTHYSEIVGLVFMLSLLIAFALSSRLQRLISNPILHLAQVAQTVAQDKNYSLRATKQSNDELGQLVDGFNEMLTQIQQRDAALQSARGDLERRVEERTAELAESQSLYYSLVDQMPAGVFRKDAEGCFVFVNSWYCRIKGMTPEQILGKTPRELATSAFVKHPEAAKEIQLAIQGADNHKWIMETGKRIDVEEQYAGADGIIQFWQVVKSPVFGSDGKITGTQGIFFNITTAKQAEAELAQERNLLRTLINNSPDAIYMKDLSGRKTLANPAELKNMGCKTEAEAIGKSDFEIYPQELAAEYFTHDQAVIQSGQSLINHEEKIITPDGETHWSLSSKIPLRDATGTIIGLVGMGRDITLIKEAETKLRQVHKQLLETSRQAGMAEVASNVLHNVGNVLNSVNVSASLVVDSVKKSKAGSLAKVVAMLREHEHDLGTFITTDAKGKQLPAYLAQLSEHLLADQKITMAELDLLLKNIGHIKEIVTMQQSYARVSGVKEIINLRELVEDSLRMNLGALDRHGVEVIREFEDVPLINIDKHKVLQVLVNLIRNAKHACQDSEKTDKQLTVRVVNGDGRIKISVIDNGVGIPPENLIRIFNHGFTTRKDGHGFGLHSGALAAKEMGGSLTAHSGGSGQGATFTLELPCTTNEDSNE